MNKNKVFDHYLKNGHITGGKPKGCFNPTKGSKISVKGQADARVHICHDKPKPKATKKSGKSGKKKSKKK